MKIKVINLLCSKKLTVNSKAEKSYDGVALRSYSIFAVTHTSDTCPVASFSSFLARYDTVFRFTADKNVRRNKEKLETANFRISIEPKFLY